jgi:hypothetical protein
MLVRSFFLHCALSYQDKSVFHELTTSTLLLKWNETQCCAIRTVYLPIFIRCEQSVDTFWNGSEMHCYSRANAVYFPSEQEVPVANVRHSVLLTGDVL